MRHGKHGCKKIKNSQIELSGARKRNQSMLIDTDTERNITLDTTTFLLILLLHHLAAHAAVCAKCGMQYILSRS